MAKKKRVTLIVLGLLLIGVLIVAIDQPGILAVTPGNSASPEEALSCPATWDEEGGFFAVETDVQTEETDTRDQSPWSSSEASYLRL